MRSAQGQITLLLNRRLRESYSVVQVLEVAVEIFVRPNHQQLDGLSIQNAIGEQTQRVDHLELVDLHTGQIAHRGFANVRGTDDGAHRFVEFSLLLTVQLLDSALESRGNE